MLRGFLFWILFSHALSGQNIQFFQTSINGDLREWNFLDDQEEYLGNLRARWPYEKLPTQWDLRLGERSGTIQLRWPNQPHDWEIRLHNDFIMAQPVWPRQLDTWRLQFKDKIYTFSLDYDPEGSLWKLSTDDVDLFVIYNTYLYSYSDWTLDYFSDVDDPILVTAACYLAAIYSNFR